MIVVDIVRGLVHLFRDEGTCALRTPRWRRPLTWSLLGPLAALAGWAGGLPAPPVPLLHLPAWARMVGYGYIAGGLVGAVLARMLTPWHGHCAVCGQCSVAAGVPTGRTRAAADAAMSSAGWAPDAVEPTPDGDTDLCPAHRDRADTAASTTPVTTGERP